jgi:hypothetical protein
MKCSLPGGPSLVDAHFAGGISPARERELRSHLPGCESCREYYERHLLLAALDPNAKPRQERLGIGLGIEAARKPSRAAPFAVVLCAAAALLFAVVPLRAKRADDFLARGTANTQDPKVLAYRIEHGQAPQTLRSAMRAADELAFAYANPGGYHKLMIFAVDEHKHVYWYHPEWTSRSDDPHAIDIAAGPEVREIPAAVSHSFDGGELTLFAVFTNEDLTVRKVEQMVQRSRALDEPLPLKDGVVKRFRISVER